MKCLVAAITLISVAAFSPSKAASSGLTQLSSSKDDLIGFAEKCNPVVKFFDPSNLTNGNFWNRGEDATIGWLRQSEIKHSRVAMAAFVGYCVQSNYVFPGAFHMDGTGAPGPEFSPEQQWDMIPEAAKWQIFGFIALLEIWDEMGGNDGALPHYTKGRKPGQYPPFNKYIDLYDPFGFSKTRTDEAKERGLVVEVNNGRLAMLGIFGFLAADKVDGAVPILSGYGIPMPYAGNVMIPFEGNFELY
mmetsp:Transcript_16933/g.18813  ORF Transcript_16933/g.18813 Transcript_16933/m.18813 type:complete len:246 (-) Transcript_16933:72-809(-)|eukprot:CAMPEP_0194130798 /NCGR_PEP_ID=MMETSP0152-20130528/1748_1 /TAXON_ID=1049557 /ORGANISM="Thalassiothrix antarctica, Strain L6-D1" /LENGTH=245 /DNA_ID=CAMNT_0038825413 /DNA_START=114 /DNA_END=851 /DNA_ORIENTATION=+